MGWSGLLTVDSKNSIPSSAGVLGVLGVCGELPFDSVGFDFGIVTEAMAAFAFLAALGMAEDLVGDDMRSEGGETRRGEAMDVTRYIRVLDAAAFRFKTNFDQLGD